MTTAEKLAASWSVLPDPSVQVARCPSHQGHVSELRLQLNNLYGALPPEIGNLSRLHVLDMNGNSLRGAIPREFMQLRQLGSLNLSDNNLCGQIPPELGLRPS